MHERNRPPRDYATVRWVDRSGAPGATRTNAFIGARTARVSRLVPLVHIVWAMLNKGDELRDRVEARKHELLAKFNELKADTRHEAAEARTRLKARLDELELQIKDGWARVTDEVRGKLNEWLDRNDDREPRDSDRRA